MKAKRLKIPAEGAWSFEAKDVAEDFDHHVRSQLPWYDFVTKGLVHVARHYVSDLGTVYDLGASTGNIGRALEPVLAARRARLISIEKSEAMAKLYRGPRKYDLKVVDAVDWFTEKRDGADLIVAFLLLMFIAPKKRRAFLETLYAALAPGGALVVVDRTALAGGYAAQVLNRLTLAGKVGTGVPAAEIVAKELSLSGVQRPLDVADLPGDPVEWFRFGDFAGWVIEKRG